jgi:hypothetical protein
MHWRSYQMKFEKGPLSIFLEGVNGHGRLQAALDGRLTRIR